MNHNMLSNSASANYLDRGASGGARPKRNSPAPNGQPYVRFFVPPATPPCGLRFRYENELRKCIIYGRGGSDNNRIPPSIEIMNYHGSAQVVVSCVSRDPPYYPHPHQLMLLGQDEPKPTKSKLGKPNSCEPQEPKFKGIVHVVSEPGRPIVRFDQLRLISTKQKEAEVLLQERKLQKIDPFNTGFCIEDILKSVDYSCFRLCFHVFLTIDGKLVALKPLLSEPIFDKKVLSGLRIHYISHCSAPVTGGQPVVLLTDKIKKNEVQLKFFCEKTGWEAIAETTEPHYHKNVAIVFQSPRYLIHDIDRPVNVKLQLIRLTDRAVSEPIDFLLKPVEHTNRELHVKKRLKYAETPKGLVQKQLNIEAMQSAKLMNNQVQTRRAVDLDVNYYLDNLDNILTNFSPIGYQSNLIS
ncbi:hypothetical protein QAD02_004612 [Eretmocerus hayati]|uniref:Uncharacterized protein n=1 Tax=Eretmocerus hayati TaxID=131215 RepID=A0ACC2NUW6_9HYME|nr:hypothetical protein QAD02_004612 [Eretmocerus hayati]